MMRCICAFGMGVMVGCCFKSCKEKMCHMMGNDHCKKDQKTKSEPYRVCRRVNILRDYPDDKIKIYP